MSEDVVGETKEEPQAASEATDAQEESLDDLLKDFEGGEEEKAEQTNASPDISALAKEVEELRMARQREQLEGELNGLAGQVRGDLPEDSFDNEFMRTWLESRAQKDPRLQKAFMERQSAPTAWKSVVKALKSDFQGRFAKMPDRQATEDVGAVTDAVRRASTKAPEQDDEISHEKARHMSDDELREYLKKFSS